MLTSIVSFLCRWQMLITHRRTGAELKDPGVRDENGMEPVPSFSSPAKPMFQPNGITQDVTYSADDSMDIDQSENRVLDLPRYSRAHLTDTCSHCRYDPRAY